MVVTGRNFKVRSSLQKMTSKTSPIGESSEMLDQSSESHQHSRRILGRESQLLDPIVVDTVLMNALASYVAANVDEVTCIIAKFLNIFITESPTLESHEVDNFILRNGQMMTNW